MKGKTLFIALMAALPALHAADVSAASMMSDEEVREKLVGAWVTAPGHRFPYDIAREKLGYFAYQQLNNDGTGGMYIFRDKYCGPIYRIIPLRWLVSGGVLTESYVKNGKPQTAHEKFLSFDGDNITYTTLNGSGAMDYQTRAPVCAIS
ncbi:MAG TPA: hypothetical protein VNW15_16460 [Rhizomicrobium sp.]|nr:hypothetical protein [Rhizomicrobium sp.]